MIFALIFICSLILQLFLPWWIFAPVAFGISLWKAKKAGKAFGSGFWAVFLLWILFALIKTLPNQNILAHRVARMFMLPEFALNWLIMLLLTGLIGGLVAGLAALTGYYFKNILPEDKK